MILTPQPWNVESEYSFLVLPAAFHWFFFLPTAVGGYLLWQRSKESILLIIYLFVVILFCSSFEELLGPRQRFQLVFVIAWMQFHFLWSIITREKGISKEAIRGSKECQ
jgi:hypothetical protein